MQGIVLRALFYPYFVTQIIGGRLAERFGAKWLTAVSVFVLGIFTALIPIAAYTHVGLVIFIRIIGGAFQGCLSALYTLYQKWFPSNEIAIAIGIVSAAGNVGLALTYPITGFLCGSEWEWPSAFYVNALYHVPWFIIWCFYVTESSEESKRISQKELQFITQNRSSKGTNVSYFLCSKI